MSKDPLSRGTKTSSRLHLLDGLSSPCHVSLRCTRHGFGLRQMVFCSCLHACFYYTTPRTPILTNGIYTMYRLVATLPAFGCNAAQALCKYFASLVLARLLLLYHHSRAHGNSFRPTIRFCKKRSGVDCPQALSPRFGVSTSNTLYTHSRILSTPFRKNGAITQFVRMG